jgi:hypothetical protein
LGHDDLAQQVEGDLSPLFAEFEAKKRQPAFRAFPPIELPDRRSKARRRRSLAWSGGVVAAVLVVAVAGALSAPWLEAQLGPRPVAAVPAGPQTERAPAAPSSVAEAVAPPAEAAPAPETPTASRAPVELEPARVEEPRPPSVVETSARDAAPAVDAAQLVPDLAATPRCAEADEGCQDLAEADRLLFYAYRQAWLAKVPSEQLRAVQRSWRPGAGLAVDDSNQALLDAYEVRTRSVWALIDRWERERKR